MTTAHVGTTAAERAQPRVALIDVARGLALVAMGVFHLAWDLSYLGFITADVANEPGWRMFSHLIAGSFLALAGAGLGLAHGGGFSGRAFWRRLGVVGLAACAVTAATLFAMPDAPVYFGILHCIALGSLMCVALARLPWWMPLALAAPVAALPAFLADTGVQRMLEASAMQPLWQHLGLTRTGPLAVDFVPIVPWLAFLLCGLGAGLWLLRSGGAARLASISLPQSAGPLIWAGQRSLPIYLIHQPVLIGTLMGLAWAMPGLTPGLQQKAEARFRDECVMECRGGRSAQICAAACSCVLDELRREPASLRKAIGTERADRATDERVVDVAQMCFRRHQPP